MNNVLVTGGAGFVGSNLVRRLCQMGLQRVVVLDDFFTGKDESLAGCDCYIVRGSVVNENVLSYLVDKDAIDTIFHLAVRNVIVSNASPREDLAVNAFGTLNVLLAAREHGCRVIYTSSASVYGNADRIPIIENTIPDLLSPYAVSKYAGEGYCRVFYESHNVLTTVLRLSNVYGTNQRPDNPYCGVVAKFMDATRQQQPVSIIGNGNQTRDFTYIDDAVDALIEAATNPRAIGETFNVGTGVETSVNTLASFVIGLNGSYIQPRYVEKRDIDDIQRRAVNVNKARRVLHWQPKIDLETGLIKTWGWMNGAA